MPSFTMPRFASMRTARFVDEMHLDTIAVLCCLFLVTLGTLHAIATSDFILKLIDLVSQAMDYLYWEVYWDFCYEFSNNGVPIKYRFLALAIICVFVLCAYFGFSMDEFKRWMDNNPEAYQAYLQEFAEADNRRRLRNLSLPSSLP
jgi:hypothetical protein